MDQVVILGMVAFLGSKFLGFVKYVVNKDWNAAVTILASWVSGVAVVFLAGAAKVTQNLIPAGFSMPLVDMDGPSKFFIGMSALSTVGFLYDWKKARDATDSAKEPKLTGLPDGKAT